MRALARGNVDQASSRWQVDEDDVRVLTYAVEDNLLSIRGDVEGLYSRHVGQMRDRSALLGGKVQDPEVALFVPRNVQETLRIGQDTKGLPDCFPVDLGEGDRRAIRSHTKHLSLPADHGSGVHDQ